MIARDVFVLGDDCELEKGFEVEEPGDDLRKLRECVRARACELDDLVLVRVLDEGHGEYQPGSQGNTSSAYRNHELRCPLPKVIPANPRNPPIPVRNPHLPPLPLRTPIPKIKRPALAINPLADNGVRKSALLKVRFRVDVRLHDSGDTVGRVSEGGVVNMLYPRAPRGVDGVLVVPHARLAHNRWI